MPKSTSLSLALCLATLCPSLLMADSAAQEPLEFERPMPRGYPVFEGPPGERQPVFHAGKAPPPAAANAEDHASAMTMREYKPEGQRYRCHLVTQVKGRAEKVGWLTLEGGCYFIVQTEFQWDERIIKNDGAEIQVERVFRESSMDTQLQADRFGLTDGAASTLNLIGHSGQQLAMITGHPLAEIGGDLVVDAAAIGRSSELP